MVPISVSSILFAKPLGGGSIIGFLGKFITQKHVSNPVVPGLTNSLSRHSPVVIGMRRLPFPSDLIPDIAQQLLLVDEVDLGVCGAAQELAE